MAFLFPESSSGQALAHRFATGFAQLAQAFRQNLTILPPEQVRGRLLPFASRLSVGYGINLFLEKIQSL